MLDTENVTDHVPIVDWGEERQIDVEAWNNSETRAQRQADQKRLIAERDRRNLAITIATTKRHEIVRQAKRCGLSADDCRRVNRAIRTIERASVVNAPVVQPRATVATSRRRRPGARRVVHTSDDGDGDADPHLLLHHAARRRQTSGFFVVSTAGVRS